MIAPRTLSVNVSLTDDGRIFNYQWLGLRMPGEFCRALVNTLSRVLGEFPIVYSRRLP